jgi:hypothetical protein
VRPLGAALALVLALTVAAAEGAKRKTPAQFPYGSEAFEVFVNDSYRLAGQDAPKPFAAWMDERLRRIQNQPWIAWINTHRSSIRSAPPEERLAKEGAVLLEIWRLVKELLPNYCLTRGFEFTYAVRYAERQCFLQSVIVTAMLQAVGFDAGIIMVNQNPNGDFTNNGHAVPLVRVSDGASVMLDASYPIPYPRHRSVFVLDTVEGRYRYVRPVYDERGAVVGFRDGQETWSPDRAAGLDFDFLRSMFDYYRGERAAGGVLARQPTARGLAESLAHFERGMTRCDENPLLVFMLARTLRLAGRHEEGMARLVQAQELYEAFGWVPVNVRDEFRRHEADAARRAASAPPAGPRT